jgi:predicted DNA-binding mobile mystery protein A
MSIKTIVSQQYRDKINQSAKTLADFPEIPPEGWLKTVRKALRMSGAALASRLGVTKARIPKAEKDELSGSLTLKTIQNMAEAMNCKFVYAVIPNDSVDSIIRQQALEKAKQQVEAAAIHMALEAQSLNNEQTKFEIERIANDLIQSMPPTFWHD